MSVTLDATVGGASANSYASLAEAEAYFNNRLYVTDWTGTDDDKKRALIMATQQIDLNDFVGYRATSTQALKWPRYGAPIPDSGGYSVAWYAVDEIPVLVKQAQYEYALLFMGSDYTAQSDLLNYKRIKVDDIELEINQPVQSGTVPADVSRLLKDLRTNASGASIVRA